MPEAPRRRKLSVDDYVAGVRAGDRSVLARAITLVESSRPQHVELAQTVLDRLMAHTGGARRVGITGVPGVGKSTFVETLGTNLTSAGHRVAVLAVDPSSARTGGSILADKTRMERLSVDERAFIRPSPSSGTLGGVASKTRETMLLCEAAGFDIVLVETVGVGQSEVVVSEMTDFFLVLMLAGAGDELQGIKRGVMEVADLIAINKADGDNKLAANKAAKTYRNVIRFLRPHDTDWSPPVLTCSALENDGVERIWEAVEEHRAKALASGALEDKRRHQQLRWLWAMVDEGLRAALRANSAVKAQLADVEQDVLDGRLSPTSAAARLLEAFGLRRG